ncbi:MAG: undecaprenyl-diphosphate phosphatase [Eubacteriales bacterium]|nr:undecaprenyl-diphosphate phosphatase [Eubacteriales bacterium]
MSILQAAILGFVQGLTEFLPVSSSGHLVLLHNIFGLEEGTLFFSIMLHVGTLIAVCIVYRKQLWQMLCHPFQHKVYMLLLALIPTVLIALLFNDFFEAAYSGTYLGAGFLLTAIILTVSERIKLKTTKTTETMKWYDALLIGTIQGVAIMPGVSRSGSTISGALFSGLDRNSAADFSFLLSIPAILGSLVLEVPDVLEAGLSSINWATVLVGMVIAAVSGYFAVRWMLTLIKSKKLWPFALYTAILGLLVLLDQLVFHVFFA